MTHGAVKNVADGEFDPPAVANAFLTSLASGAQAAAK